jgi:hypothetical protein
MTKSCGRLFLFPWLAIVSLGCYHAPRGQWVWDVGDASEYRPSPQLLEKLNAKTSVRFEGESLQRVFDRLHETTGVRFHVNWLALETVAIERNAEVDLKLTDASLAMILECLLRNLEGGETELGFHIKNDVIMVSTKEDLSRCTIVRIYDVGDLINSDNTRTSIYHPGHGGDLFGEQEPSWKHIELNGTGVLSKVVQELVEPNSWRYAGGNVGTLDATGVRLFIRQTPECHRQIEALLSTLRLAMRDV